MDFECQHSQNPFSDTNGDVSDVESASSAASAEVGPLMASPAPEHPSDDSSETKGPLSSYASEASLVTSWKSSDDVADCGSPNAAEDTGRIQAARKRGPSRWLEAEGELEQVLMSRPVLSLGL